MEGIRDSTPPSVLRQIPEEGSILSALRSVEIIFTEPIAGIQAEDLLINTQPATRLTQLGPEDYLFEFPGPTEGIVQVAFRPDHKITDRSKAAHPLTPGHWSYRVDSQAPLSPVLINEFLADNKSGIRDNNGDRSDWIELRNFGASSVSLKNWSLTDDPAIPAKWVFPSVTMRGGEFLLVYASGVGATNNPKALHTNFKLSKGPAFLGLYSEKGMLVYAYTNYPTQRADASSPAPRSQCPARRTRSYCAACRCH